MKKITAIVLAMVMVFAFVGSASALTNREPLDITTATASVPSITLDLQIISSIIGLPTAGSIINWASFNAEANAYLEGQVVYFNAQIGADGYYAYYNTGAGSALAANATAGKQIWDTIDTYGLDLLVESTGMNFSLATITAVENTKTATTPSYDVMGIMSPTAAANVTRTVGSVNVAVCDGTMADLDFYKLNFLFDAVVTAENPVVTATLIAGPGLSAFPALNTAYPVFGAALTTAANAPFATYFTVEKTRAAAAGMGNAAYKVNYASAIAAVTAADNDNAAPGTAVVAPAPTSLISLTFDLQNNGTLASPNGLVLTYTVPGDPAVTTTYRVGMGTNQAATSRWGFETITGTQILSTADIAALNLLINAMFEQFGFSYSLNGRIIDMDFIAPANFVLQDSVTVKTATATIDDGDGDDVPVTGDVASTFGFVMIAVAIVATASLAIVAKKAR